MPKTDEQKPPARFPLTTRQIRLRYTTYIVLGIVLGMIALGMLHPVFRMKPPAVLTDPRPTLTAAELQPIRKAFAVKLLLIGIYWATAVVLTLLLPVFAWLYAREIQLQELMARRDIWREVSGRQPAESPPDADRPV